MKLHAHAGAASIALLVLGGAITLEAQNRAALIVTGTLNASYNGPAEGPFDSFFGDFKLKHTLNPGFELLVKPESRISFGAAFTRMKFEREPFTFVPVRDRFQYVDRSGRLVTVEMPGTIFVSHTTRGEGHMNMLIGLAYVNLVTTGRVRPFVGIGTGIGLTKHEIVSETFVHPLYVEAATEEEGVPLITPSPSSEEEKKSLAVFAGKLGVNIYPTRRLIIRASGGYLNGGYGEVGVGIVF